MKRFIDTVGSSLGILFIAPFFPFIALAIKLTSKGPIFVKLNRVSSGKVIMAYKFRSMTENAQETKKDFLHLNERKDGPFFKIKNDPRITRVGRILRKFRVDEFPQLINVLKGKLSLVGPRPHEPEEVVNYPEEYRHIPLAKAGITGLSQINGASSLPFLNELKLDNEYLNRQSIWLDFKILLRTVYIFFCDPTGI